jgi:hypothetical protein
MPVSTNESRDPNFDAIYQRMKYGEVSPQAQYYGNPDQPYERISQPENLDRYTGVLQNTGIYVPTTPFVPELPPTSEGSNALVITPEPTTRAREGEILDTNSQTWAKRAASGIKPATNEIPVRNDSPIFL